MRILECPLLKNRIALGCIGLLGLSAFSGLMHTSASSGFFTQISSIFNRFGANRAGAAAQPQDAGSKISPAQWVAKTGSEVWKDYITPFVTITYEWTTNTEKRNSVWGVLKEFWNYKFFKGLMPKLPRIVFSWVNILTNGESRKKILLAWKYTLVFFNFVVTNPTFKAYSSGFVETFAELLFLPHRAIRKLVKKGQGQRACEGQGDSNEGVKICISVSSSADE